MAFDNVPPAYTPLASPSEVDPQALEPDCEKAVQIARAGVRVQRYFVEIIAYRLKADFTKSAEFGTTSSKHAHTEPKFQC
jgi:hypothetical protein